MILLLYNVRSLFPKLDFLKLECIDRKPDVVCLTETWLDSSVTDEELSIPGLNLIHLDRNHHGGGVALYINVNFPYKVIYLGDDSFECVIVCVLTGCCKLCFCLFYRPPNSSFDVLDSLYSVLCSIDVALYSHFSLLEIS